MRQHLGIVLVDVCRYVRCVDCLGKPRVAEERGSTFFGAAFVSDESPPSGNRYTGLRFQITWLYVPFFKPVEEWGQPAYENQYPLTVKKLLCDICHVGQKTGQATFQVILKQIGRLGLTEFDVVGGVGDGGGENEGVQGVHTLFEESQGSYVRRRCGPHFAWRTFAAGVAAMGDFYQRSLALNNYLRDGVTWTRLQAIAVQHRDDHGLELFAEGSPEFLHIFSASPPRLIDERPQATLDYFQWLLPREHILKVLINQDMLLRGLTGADAVQAHETINSPRDCAFRRIDTVLMQKSLFMFFFIKKYNFTVECSKTFEELIDEASDIITSSQCTENVIKTLGLAEADIDADAHWVDVALQNNVGLTAEEREMFQQDAMNYHTKVSMVMASHMRLTAANMLRPTWAAGGMLSKDPAKAQQAAATFQDALIRKAEGTHTAFERCFLDDERLLTQLGQFVDTHPPLVLWHGRGRFKELFEFLGARFLSAPDHVLDAEGTHALWKWIELFKRGVSFRVLNCLLRLQSYLRANGGEFPQTERLEQFCAEVAARQLADARLAAAEGVGARQYSRMLHLERFNLSAQDLNLLKQTIAAGNPCDSTVEAAWGNYVRFLFDANAFYQFTTLSNELFLYVARNKTAPGRQQVAAGETYGRLVTFAWFTLDQEYHGFVEDGIVVRPVVMDDVSTLFLRNATIAELIRAAGHYIENEGTAREMEIKYEKAFATLDVVRFNGSRFLDGNMPWQFLLTEPVDIEQYAFANRPPQDVTKMCLARRLQILDGSDDATRCRRWELTRDALIALLQDHHAGGGLDLGGGAPDDDIDHDEDDDDAGKGRGRGRGRGRGPVPGPPRGGRGRGGGRRGRGAGGRGGRGRGRGRAADEA